MKIFPTATALGLGTALATLMAACGSSTPTTVTVTASSSASATSRTTADTSAVASATSSRSSSTSATRPTATTTATATATPSATTTTATTTITTTRTETAPAFVQTNPASSVAISHDLAAALAVLTRSGYVPLTPSTYHAGDTLHVVIGTRPGAGAPAERAFFFDQTIYLGTDARRPSAQISLLSHNDTEVTLGYAIYRAGASTPSGVRRVRFALDMGQLSALDPLPSITARR